MRAINDAFEGAAAFGNVMRRLVDSTDEATAAQRQLRQALEAARETQRYTGENRAARRAREQAERRAAKRQKATTR